MGIIRICSEVRLYVRAQHSLRATGDMLKRSLAVAFRLDAVFNVAVCIVFRYEKLAEFRREVRNIWCTTRG